MEEELKELRARNTYLEGNLNTIHNSFGCGKQDIFSITTIKDSFSSMFLKENTEKEYQNIVSRYENFCKEANIPLVSSLSINKFLKDMGKSEYSLGVHCFRFTHAFKKMQKIEDQQVEELKNIFGHKDKETTRIYLNN